MTDRLKTQLACLKLSVLSVKQMDGFVDSSAYFHITAFLPLWLQLILPSFWKLLKGDDTWPKLNCIKNATHVFIFIFWGCFYNGQPQWDLYPWPRVSAIAIAKQRPALNLYISQMENDEAAAQCLSKEKLHILIGMTGCTWHHWKGMYFCVSLKCIVVGREECDASCL